MAADTDKTAHVAHANAFSIVAVVAGLVTAVAIFAALLFVNYDRDDHFNGPPTTLTNAAKTGSGSN